MLTPQTTEDLAVIAVERVPQVTVSAGVAAYQHEGDVQQLIARADRALDRAKTEGRNRTCAD